MGDDHVDVDRVQFPHKEYKVGALSKSSRPPSPDILAPTMSEVRKHGPVVGRKRKHNSVEVCGVCMNE